LYNDILKENATLKAQNKKQEAELLSLKLPANNYVKINECLRINMSIMRKKLDTTSKHLKNTINRMSRDVERLSLDKNNITESEHKN